LYATGDSDGDSGHEGGGIRVEKDRIRIWENEGDGLKNGRR